MNINRKNYESYFIDLLDGTLSTEQVDAVLDFLRVNPDLAEEIKNLEQIKLVPLPSAKLHFNHLKKSELDQTDILEETCIRSIENDLSDFEEKKFRDYIQTNHHAANEYRLFKATISEPDSLIAYENIGKLKKTHRISSLWYAVAAVISIGLFFWFSYKPQQTPLAKPLIMALVEKPEVKLQAANYRVNMLRLAEVEKVTVHQNQSVTAPKQIAEYIEHEQILPLTGAPVLAVVEKSDSDVYALQTLEPNRPAAKEQMIFPDAKELLAKKIEEIDPQQEVNKIAHFALNKLSNASKNKLGYTTNSKGKLDKLEFNSRLLAFSVPINPREF